MLAALSCHSQAASILKDLSNLVGDTLERSTGRPVLRSLGRVAEDLSSSAGHTMTVCGFEQRVQVRVWERAAVSFAWSLRPNVSCRTELTRIRTW